MTNENYSRFFVLALAALLLAGCLESKKTHGSEAALPSNHLINSSKWPSLFGWTDCIGGSSLSYGPNDVFEAPVPPGWRFDWPINEVYLLVAQCQRMSVGPYERGPVRMVLETYSAASQPQSCLNGTFDRPDMMSNWWIDDKDIAAYLQGLGAPAHYATIDYASQSAGAARVDQWTWHQEGHDDSWVSYPDHGQVPGSIPFLERIFWFNQTTLGVMDLLQQGHYDAGAVPAGQMSPPSLYAFAGATLPYSAARGGIYYDVELSATLQFFGDFQCKQPLA
jgi:hypothetical protein